MSGIAPLFVKATISDGPSICGATYMKHSRPASQKTSGGKVSKLERTRASCRE